MKLSRMCCVAHLSKFGLERRTSIYTLCICFQLYDWHIIFCACSGQNMKTKRPSDYDVTKPSHIYLVLCSEECIPRNININIHFNSLSASGTHDPWHQLLWWLVNFIQYLLDKEGSNWLRGNISSALWASVLREGKLIRNHAADAYFDPRNLILRHNFASGNRTSRL